MAFQSLRVAFALRWFSLNRQPAQPAHFVNVGPVPSSSFAFSSSSPAQFLYTNDL